VEQWTESSQVEQWVESCQVGLSVEACQAEQEAETCLVEREADSCQVDLEAETYQEAVEQMVAAYSETGAETTSLGAAPTRPAGARTSTGGQHVVEERGS
jgi:hypothetical protein